MKLIFSHTFRQGEGLTALSSFSQTGQQKILTNEQELVELTEHLHCKVHPYAMVPMVTVLAGGRICNRLFVCCAECRDALIQALQYSSTPFEITCWSDSDTG